MTLSATKSIFGIHSITAYNPDTLEPYGIAKVLGQASLNFSGELTPLTGGSSPYPWRVERGLISTEVSITLREKPVWEYEVLQGKAATQNAAEASGAVSTALTNAGGTSVMDASTGIATATVKSGSETDLKTGLYVVVAATATTVNVYSMSDVDFAQGTNKVFEDDTLKINASPLTITSGTAVEVPDFGVELTGGSGTIGMTAGDTAFFEVRAINTGSHDVVIGSSTENYVDFGLYMVGQKSGSKNIFAINNDSGCYADQHQAKIQLEKEGVSLAVCNKLNKLQIQLRENFSAGSMYSWQNWKIHYGNKYEKNPVKIKLSLNQNAHD